MVAAPCVASFLGLRFQESSYTNWLTNSSATMPAPPACLLFSLGQSGGIRDSRKAIQSVESHTHWNRSFVRQHGRRTDCGLVCESAANFRCAVKSRMLKTLLTDDGGIFSSRAMARTPNPLFFKLLTALEYAFKVAGRPSLTPRFIAAARPALT